MAIDPNTLPDEEAYATPPPFEGEQVLTLEDFDLRVKPTGFWLLLDLRGENGERASWSGNFHKAPDTPGRKQNHNISWAGFRSFCNATGMTDGDIPACAPKPISELLSKMINVNGTAVVRVRAKVGMDSDGKYMQSSGFKAA